MAHQTVEAAIVGHFEALFAGQTESVSFRKLDANEEPEEPKTRADEGKAHVFLEFEPSVEEGAGLGLAGYEHRRASGMFYIHALVAKDRGDDNLRAVWGAIKKSLRTPMIGDVHIGQDLFEGDKGLRYGGRWEGRSLAADYSFDFDGSL